MSKRLEIMEKPITDDLNKDTEALLTACTQYIQKCIKGVQKNSFQIAKTMLKVDEHKLYLAGYKSIIEYGEKTFGFKKATTYNLLKIARLFISKEKDESLLIHKTKDYTDSQLYALIPMETAKAVNEELIKKNKISENSTVREIEKVVKEYKAENETDDTKKKSSKSKSKEKESSEQNGIIKCEVVVIPTEFEGKTVLVPNEIKINGKAVTTVHEVKEYVQLLADATKHLFKK